MVVVRRPLAFLSFCRTTSSLLASRQAPFLLGSGLVVSLAPRSSFSFNTKTSCDSIHMQVRNSADTLMTGYLNAEDAASLDAELMSTPGFSLEQLMELAGLSVAEAVYTVVGPASEARKPKIILVCGPGNNGGDGLVAARHLVMFGYHCTVVYPKPSSKQHFVNLVAQCVDVGIAVVDALPDDILSDDPPVYDAIVDAIFGFSFHGPLREPFATILNTMKEAQQSLHIPTLSVDIPSGWDVNGGDEAGTGFVPDVLISLTAPKHSAKHFTGRHFVGGRFLPPKLAEKYGIQMPPYPGVSQVMEVSTSPTEKEPSWEEGYAAYCAEKEANLNNPTNIATDSKSWEVQYAAYLAEKESNELDSKT